MASPAPEPATRRALLEALKRHGAQTAQMLANDLKITAMAVRQHLYAMEAEGLAGWATTPGFKGRPSKYWSLTSEANRLFPDAHQDFAVELIASLRETLGEDGFAKVLEHRGAAQAERYRQRMPGDDLAAKVATLAAIRTEEGYMATSWAEPDGLVLAENHCPVCAVAKTCTGICANELAVFRAALGPGATVERTEHILKGARRCAYKVKPASR